MRLNALRTAATVRVSVAGTQVGVFRLDDTTVAVPVPDTTGPVALTVDLNGVRAAEGVVTVHGFEAIRAGPRVSSFPNPWPANGPTALAFQDGRLVRLDYRDNSATVLTPDTNLGWPCFLLPIPSAADPGLVAVAGRSGPSSCGFMTAVPVSAGASPADTSYWSGWSWGTGVDLAEGRWLISGDNSTFLADSTAPGGARASVCGESANMIVSPRRDRVVPLCGNDAWFDSTAAGAPVIDVSRYTVAYHIAGIGWLVAAAFTEGGDTLFAVGTSQLVAVAAATGAVLGRMSHDYFPRDTYIHTAAVMADPGRPWLYVLGWADGHTPVPFIDVYDRSSLARVARLRIPPWAAASVPSINSTRGDWTVLVSPAERRLYATMTNWAGFYYGTQETSVLVFDLMP